jgi:hypothetical protein
MNHGAAELSATCAHLTRATHVSHAPHAPHARRRSLAPRTAQAVPECAENFAGSQLGSLATSAAAASCRQRLIASQ